AGVWADIKMHVQEIYNWTFDPRGWLTFGRDVMSNEAGFFPSLWPSGVNNIRVQYTAGFTTIPEAVQEGCAEWINFIYYTTSRDPAIASTSSAPSGGTATSTVYQIPSDSPPPH